MEYSKEFQQAVAEAVEKGIYLGTGNPNAKILVVGQELGFDPNNEDQFEREVLDNAFQWQSLINNLMPKHNPLDYGYKIPDKPGHTWNKYLGIHNRIFGVYSDKFCDNFFITELNDKNPSKKGNQQNDTLRNNTIKERIEYIASSPFFQSFPIVIMANGNYAQRVEGKDIICRMFNVSWLGDERMIGISRGNWCSVHLSNDDRKLVIHTKQLSGQIPNKLLDEIALEIKLFLLSEVQQ